MSGRTEDSRPGTVFFTRTEYAPHYWQTGGGYGIMIIEEEKNKIIEDKNE